MEKKYIVLKTLAIVFRVTAVLFFIVFMIPAILIWTQHDRGLLLVMKAFIPSYGFVIMGTLNFLVFYAFGEVIGILIDIRREMGRNT